MAKIPDIFQRREDLKLIDELLCILRQQCQLSWEAMETKHFLIVRDAMKRLREAWAGGEMSELSADLARYFRETEIQPSE